MNAAQMMCLDAWLRLGSYEKMAGPGPFLLTSTDLESLVQFVWDRAVEETKAKYEGYTEQQIERLEGEGKIKRDLSTPESRKFWASCEAASKEVLTWPDWKRAGINTAPALSEPRELPPKEKLLNLSTEELEAELRKK